MQETENFDRPPGQGLLAKRHRRRFRAKWPVPNQRVGSFMAKCGRLGRPGDPGREVPSVGEYGEPRWSDRAESRSGAVERIGR